MNLWKRAGSMLAILIAALFAFTGNALASTGGGVDVSDALRRSGISQTGDMSGVYNDLNGLVYVVMAIGGFWIVGCLIWGGMTLAGSGGNPQKRTEGFAKLALTLVGAWIIFKAYDIAGWATGIGGASGTIVVLKDLAGL
jgi:hypothetical protein